MTDRPLSPLPHAFYARASVEVARDLLGKTLWRRTEAGLTAGIIVETEAYDGANDPASHAWRGRTQRNAVMFGPPGHAYVYFTYGMHYCMNTVTGPVGQASGVLLRAIQPIVGLDIMRDRRGVTIPDRDLARGPGRLCQALGITTADNATDLAGDALWISETADAPDLLIATTPRVGITRAAERPWRFVVCDNQYVSGRTVRSRDVQ
ncbi:MAG TPA: DNA-3-methyladenine glycosylase [Ktedonobacterales bacterium]